MIKLKLLLLAGLLIAAPVSAEEKTFDNKEVVAINEVNIGQPVDGSEVRSLNLSLGDYSRYFPEYYPEASKATEDYIGYTPKSVVDAECLYAYGRYEVTLFSPKCGEDGERLWSQTKLMFGLGVGVAGVIWLLPEDISGWNKDDPSPLRESWRDNVRDGPVWDQDSWAINYIGHPYFGGVYYQVARKSGYNEWNSFTYTALMSTFYWEYGLEAFAEVPSIQDLIVTPFAGAVYGEWAYRKEREIRARGGLVWNSRFWGGVSLFLLDPVDKIAGWINGAVGREWIKTGTVAITQAPTPMEFTPNQDDYLGFKMSLNF